jgi:hypothetical protein
MRYMTTVLTDLSIAAMCCVSLFACAQSDPCAKDDTSLISRFRPMLRSSHATITGDEVRRPTTWQDLVANSTLMTTTTSSISEPLTVAGTWSPDFHELITSIVNLSDGTAVSDGSNLKVFNQSSSLSLAVKQNFDGGEAWPDAANGDGFYAHAERVGALSPNAPTDTRLLNIEYIVLWAQNYGEAAFNAHDGDITTMMVLYDPVSDKAVRLTYAAHGCILQAFQLGLGQTTRMASLAGKDANLNPITDTVVQVDIDDSNHGTFESGVPCSGWTTSDKHIFLAPDLGTGLYEHPAVFPENGTHEFWPNGSGTIPGGGGHAGNFVSYIPAHVENLGTFENPTPADSNFLLYNGLVGSDPQTFVLHKTWCWPTLPNSDASIKPCSDKLNVYTAQDGRSMSIPDSRFKEVSPYDQSIGSLGWPQIVDEGAKAVYVAPAAQVVGQIRDGSASLPFGGIRMAYSFAPAGSTLLLASGTYGESLTFCRSAMLKSTGGAAVLGR